MTFKDKLIETIETRQKPDEKQAQLILDKLHMWILELAGRGENEVVFDVQSDTMFRDLKPNWASYGEAFRRLREDDGLKLLGNIHGRLVLFEKPERDHEGKIVVDSEGDAVFTGHWSWPKPKYASSLSKVHVSWAHLVK